MEEGKVKTIKEEITEIKETVKDVSAVVNDMRVLIAGNYVTKQDFEEYKKESVTNTRWWSGFIITLMGACTALVNLLWKN